MTPITKREKALITIIAVLVAAVDYLFFKIVDYRIDVFTMGDHGFPAHRQWNVP
jgi:hypothetical protein